ncbi:MAG: RNA-directed DNA polymerase [Phycisphaeraceae bacterium]|nr:RNA-directed DNA polymerase [Phycisphaeraceae bacterium]
MLVPKSQGGFRVATQLDPLDALLYAAMGYEAAAKIEDSRVPADKRVACSFRLSPQSTGDLFVANADGWKDFQEHSGQLAKHRSCDFVALADISDFYNQIYHHRLNNSLAAAMVPAPRPDSVEAFIGRFTAQQSRGIPVGPSTSILLAEACLSDVDHRLIHCGFNHTRYVDDFRIFCKSEAEAVHALHEITHYLFTAHRLSLQAHKTRIVLAKDFIRQELVEPEERENAAKISQGKRLIERAMDAAAYAGLEVDEDEILEAKEQEIVRKALLSTFKSCVRKPPIHLGLGRYVLRRASSLRIRALLRPVVEHLPILTPVFREVIHYFDRIWNDEVRDVLSSALPDFLSKDSQGWLPFVRDWTLWLAAKRQFLPSKTAIQLADDSKPTLVGCRYRALLAGCYGEVDWVRDQKERWMNAGPWERRAILWAGSALPRDERRAWLEPVTRSLDLTDAAIAKRVRALS